MTPAVSFAPSIRAITRPIASMLVNVSLAPVATRSMIPLTRPRGSWTVRTTKLARLPLVMPATSCTVVPGQACRRRAPGRENFVAGRGHGFPVNRI